MTPPLTASHLAIRDHVERAYPAWKRDAELMSTPSGTRYRVDDVVDLFAPVLRAVGLHVAFDPDTYEERFCTPSGRHLTVNKVRDLLFDSVGPHPDARLLDALAGREFYRRLRTPLPTYDGVLSVDRSPASPSTSDAAFLAAFLRETVTRPMLASDVFERYEDAAAGDGRDPLGRTTFYAAAVASGLVTRRRLASGRFLVPVANRRTA